MDEAIALAKRGTFVDIDTTEEDLGKWLSYYRAHGGPPDRLTVSSDAQTPGGSPAKLYGQLVSCVREHEMPLEEVLPHFTANTATALKLPGKGRLEEKQAADLLIMRKETLEVVHVIARGQPLLKDGKLLVKESQA